MSRSFVSIQKEGGDETAGILCRYAAVLSLSKAAQSDTCADQQQEQQRLLDPQACPDLIPSVICIRDFFVLWD